MSRSNSSVSSAFTENGSLTMIIGPMFSGKTTELKRLIRNAYAKRLNFLLIRHSSDVRKLDNSSEEAECFLTNHDGERLDVSIDGNPKRMCISTHDLKEVNIDGYDVVAIEEGQFFDDITTVVMQWIRNKKKNVIVVGLVSYAAPHSENCLYPLNNILHLIPHANKTECFKSVCNICLNDEGLYHYRLEHIDAQPQMYVGGTEDYGVACLSCIQNVK